MPINETEAERILRVARTVNSHPQAFTAKVVDASAPGLHQHSMAIVYLYADGEFVQNYGADRSDMVVERAIKRQQDSINRQAFRLRNAMRDFLRAQDVLTALEKLQA